ncbi:MAG: LuxR C-terminal-related transcriptional regulator [Candidatus Azobacteroides sp.]|nr:LuxR C-terminal-related transcriptional regulator [Candidatus Azobacteroides sp.]
MFFTKILTLLFSVFPVIPCLTEWDSTERNYCRNGYESDSWDREGMYFTGLHSYPPSFLKPAFFPVRKMNPDRMNRLQAEILFEIQPLRYRTKIVRAAYFILIAASLYLLFRWLLNRERVRQKEKSEKQKTEELKDLEEIFRKQQDERDKEMMLQIKVLEHELKVKNNELTHSKMNIVEKNKIFNLVDNGLSRMIADLKSEKDNEMGYKLRRLRAKIKQNITQDDYWEKVEKIFDSVHEDFFKKLTEAYPDLSKTERKICAYLRMNLSSKEIAQLTNIAPGSVEVTRYRIRKKMGLKRTDSLIEILRKI